MVYNTKKQCQLFFYVVVLEQGYRTFDKTQTAVCCVSPSFDILPLFSDASAVVSYCQRRLKGLSSKGATKLIKSEKSVSSDEKKIEYLCWYPLLNLHSSRAQVMII